MGTEHLRPWAAQGWGLAAPPESWDPRGATSPPSGAHASCPATLAGTTGDPAGPPVGARLRTGVTWGGGGDRRGRGRHLPSGGETETRGAAAASGGEGEQGPGSWGVQGSPAGPWLTTPPWSPSGPSPALTAPLRGLGPRGSESRVVSPRCPHAGTSLQALGHQRGEGVRERWSWGRRERGHGRGRQVGQAETGRPLPPNTLAPARGAGGTHPSPLPPGRLQTRVSVETWPLAMEQLLPCKALNSCGIN